jgi:hypothetical protein
LGFFFIFEEKVAKMKISKREIKIFILGFISCVVLQGIIDWEDSVRSFKEGWNSVVAINTTSDIIS